MWARQGIHKALLARTLSVKKMTDRGLLEYDQPKRKLGVQYIEERRDSGAAGSASSHQLRTKRDSRSDGTCTTFRKESTLKGNEAKGKLKGLGAELSIVYLKDHSNGLIVHRSLAMGWEQREEGWNRKRKKRSGRDGKVESV